MLGIPKEVVFKDLGEVLAKAMGETGDFDTEKYCFVFNQVLFRTVEIWLFSENILNIEEIFNNFRGVKIEIRPHTQYFFLEYSNSNFYPTAEEIEKISATLGDLAVDEKNIKKIPLTKKIFAPSETIKKYIQAA